jgi:16S rRNA (uracil1498-N3)-methyltransferase
VSEHRLFVPPESIRGDIVHITGSLAHKLRIVLRLKAGDHIVVLDNTSTERKVRLDSLRGGEVRGSVLTTTQCANEPKTRIALFQALLKGSSFDLVLQKCTEIGVSTFVPVMSERCVAREPGPARADRWERIVLEAAQQSRRALLPLIHPVTSFDEACRSSTGPSLILWEGERIAGLKNVLHSLEESDPVSINVFVGPEGGFSIQEIESARASGIIPTSMGGRILRAETAGLAASAALLYEFGEMG